MWNAELKHFDWVKGSDQIVTNLKKMHDIGIYPDNDMHRTMPNISVTSHVTGKNFVFEFNNNGAAAYWLFSPIDKSCPIKNLIIMYK